MIFLIVYDRARRRLERIDAFDASERSLAQQARLDLELEHGRGKRLREVVILEAASEAALRRTHRRYFESAKSISDSSISATGTS
jgi:hypothetical protein